MSKGIMTSKGFHKSIGFADYATQAGALKSVASGLYVLSGGYAEVSNLKVNKLYIFRVKLDSNDDQVTFLVKFTGARCRSSAGYFDGVGDEPLFLEVNDGSIALKRWGGQEWDICGLDAVAAYDAYDLQ